MSLNKNSSREEILNYINVKPLNFLDSFSDKPWAEPYIDVAAREVVKKNPLYFLIYFSHKSWVQPYIDEAVKEAAKKDPELFLKKLADKYPQGINWALFALGDKNGSR